jgi:hypothetical protein
LQFIDLPQEPLEQLAPFWPHALLEPIHYFIGREASIERSSLTHFPLDTVSIWLFRKRRSQTGHSIALRHLCADPDRRSHVVSVQIVDNAASAETSFGAAGTQCPRHDAGRAVQTGLCSVSTVRHYIRDGNFRENAAGGLGL